MSLLQGLTDLLYPPACQVCRMAGSFPLCVDCREGFRLIHPPLCRKCGKPLRGPPSLIFTCIPCRHRRLSFAAARAAGLYEGALREAIHALKFGRRRALAEPLGELMAAAAASDPALRRVGAIVPVPLHPRRLRERGFNQSDLLAAAAAARLGVPPVRGILVRTRCSEAQSGLSFDERRANVKGAFAVTGRVSAGVVLLIDDVLSTGFTASECARVLRRDGGAKEVFVLTAALAVLV